MKRILTTLAGVALAVPIAQAEMQSPQTARHVLSLDDVEITALIDDVSIITGYTFILHPDVTRTRVTVLSQAPMSTDEVFQVFLSTLRVNGFAAIPAGKGVYRIVPEQLAVGEAIGGDGPNAFVTQIFHLDTFGAVEAAQMIKPLVDAQGQVVANSRSNSVVVVDYASNMGRIRDVVNSLDNDDRTEVRTIALNSVPSKEMSQILKDLLGTRDGNPVPNFEVTSSPTSNSVVIRGDAPLVQRAVTIAAELDQADPARDNIRVIELNNSRAEEIVPVLEKIASTMADQRSPAEGGLPPATIAFHQESNSLIISATPDTLLAMERVVEALDQRRAQVLVEAIIVEMSDDTARELGVQFLLSGVGDSTTPFASTSFSRSAPNLLALAGALIDPGVFSGNEDGGGTNPFRSAAVGSLLGVNGALFGVGGRDGDTLFGAILNAVEQDTTSRVLSKPFNMTLDNGTSSLLVGQNVPLTSGEVLGDSNSNPFRTVQREDVGVKLEVTPRISSDDTIRLDIYQEVSSVFGQIGTLSPDLILDTRQIETSVLADDGEIIVLGGLIEQRETTQNSKVPVLGDIPVAGNLFKSEGRGGRRTNLMVFIKPTIVRDRESAARVTARSYNYIRAQELLLEDEPSVSLDEFLGEVLTSPAMPQ